ncbi:PREDICTED: myoferlin-like [Tinamus guttatus]|uniref:myoferlin-like n=1 Tax=Tinamus guttatus TaxID=94827 RepID=UPI00052F37C9|nr:PREDICTED: myoferlin-like [Tinamus guttatus]
MPLAASRDSRQQRFLRRRTAGLCAVFSSATMLPHWDELLQVEVSVGHYGNRAEGSCKAATTATQHGRPIYDGNRYYYLPWFDTKPVVALTSSWEDMSHRWDVLNALQAVHDRLVRGAWGHCGGICCMFPSPSAIQPHAHWQEHNLASLRRLRAHDADWDEAGKRLLRDLLEGCKKVLLGLEAQATVTVLDGHLRAARVQLLQQLESAARDARPSYFQLRCYIFQAMDLAPGGAKDTADPVAHVSFVHLSQSTRVLEGTLEPRWDQTLLFERVLLHGDPQGARAEPPPVVVEVFDQDGGGAGTFLGRSVCRPAVCLDVGGRRLPRLHHTSGLDGPGE